MDQSPVSQTDLSPVSQEAIVKALQAINAIHAKVTRILDQAEEAASREADEIYLTVREVAPLTRYTEQTLRTKVMRGEIPSVLLHGKRLFRKSDILRWMANGGSR